MKDLTLFQQIYDLCDARIKRNNALREEISVFTSVQEIKESGIFSSRATEVWDTKEKQKNQGGWYAIQEEINTGNRFFLRKIEEYIDKDNIKYLQIKSKIQSITNLMLDSSIEFIDEDVFINNYNQVVIELIEGYQYLITPFWSDEYSGKPMNTFCEEHTEYYHVLWIKEQWEALLPKSFNDFWREYMLLNEPEIINLKDEPIAFKICVKKADYTFKEKNYKDFINNVAKNFKQFYCKLNKLQQQQPEKCNQLQELLTGLKKKINNFYDTIYNGNKQLIDHSNKILNGEAINGSEIILISLTSKYKLYIFAKYILDELNKLNSQLPIDLQLSAKEIKELTPKLNQLIIQENKARNKLDQEEQAAIKITLNDKQEELSIITQNLTLSSLHSKETLYRKRIQDNEQKAIDKMYATFQKNKLLKFSRQQNSFTTGIVTKKNPILDARVFLIEPEIILKNFKLLEEIMHDDVKNLKFEEASNLVFALGGKIVSNNRGGSHHKIIFQERITSCFDTISSIVKPHGKDKENAIKGFALKAFKAAIQVVLPENWRTLKLESRKFSEFKIIV